MVLKKNDPLRLDVSYLVKGSPGTHEEFEFSFPQLNFSSKLTLVDIQGKINISVTEDGVVAEGKLGALTQLDCSRCLNVFWQPLEINFTEIFSNHPAEDSGEQKLSADRSIDLTPIIRDYATLDIPIRQICAEDCKGLCAVCGMNLNQKDCGHRQESIDPRMEGLRELLENKDSSE
ncbi:MAG: DUF177 domain-containing protein [Anaerolineales bacterium]